MNRTSTNVGPYGIRRVFKTEIGPVLATTREEAKRRVREVTNKEPGAVQGPKVTESLRGLGVRAIVRQMNRRAA